MKFQTPLRVAIIGAGRMGFWHGRAAQHLGAKIIAISDTDATRAKALARELRTRCVVADASSFLRTDCIDVVHICSPLSSHSALARAAIASHIHTLVEKPLAKSAKETRSLFDLARQSDVILSPVHQVAFQDGVAHAAEAVAALGNLSAIELRICSAGGVGRSERELDDIVGEILPHPLSVLRRLWPDAVWEPEHWFVTHPRRGELLICGEYADALLSIFISMHARPTCFEMTAYGSQGAIQLDFFHGFVVTHDGRTSRLRKITRPFAEAFNLFGMASMNLLVRAFRGETAYPGLRRLIRAFYCAVRGESAPPISAKEAIEVASARDAILAAAGLLSAPEGQIDSAKSAP